MSLNLKKIVGNIFHDNNWGEDENATSSLQQKLNSAQGTATNRYVDRMNPYLRRDGSLANPYLNYQGLLDSDKVNSRVKSYITNATGLTPTVTFTTTDSQDTSSTETTTTSDNEKQTTTTTTSPESIKGKSLASLDVVTELPKLSVNQISSIIKQYFGKSTVIGTSDAQGIYDAQQKSGMSALAILGIGALESGYGTSNIAKKKNNLWGWNATNVNPMGNAKSFSPVSQGALEFANSYLKTYYNKYGAKSIYSAGTGNNPAKKGYAYYDNGTINSSWSTSIGKIMDNFYKTAQSVK